MYRDIGGTMTQCVFQFKLDNKRCEEEAVTSDDLCIFHDPSLEKAPATIKERLKALRAATANDDVLRLDGSVFPQGVSFYLAPFNSSVRFCGAEFHDNDFRGAQFLGQTTDFSGAEFHGETIDFKGAKFHSQATDFSHAEFYGKRTSFTDTQFYGNTTSFSYTEFRGETTDFDGAKFNGETTNFSGARFHGETNFRRTEFHGEKTDFMIAEFYGKALFSGRVYDGLVFDESAVTFERASVSQSAEIIFDVVNLSKTNFRAVDLTRAKFLDVRWNHAAGWWRGGWRSRLYDETLWQDQHEVKPSEADNLYLPSLGRNYRALKSYYRQTGEYHLVGHFHYGLMEVQWHQRELDNQTPAEATRGRRLWLWLISRSRKWVSWEALYRFSSGYGEDYAWSALILTGLIVAFAAFYWLLGVPAPAQTSSWSKVLAALAYSLQTASIGRLQYFKDSIPPSPGAEIAYTFESILGPIQIAFFVVALRNRFRR